eukprot:CAMPEP_0114641654 /NCGR_PEP_ID=MMETSP0191-20121206/2382_1 /TAXON_ID=126664 /ORGANISM="Sorites sp." /LENGTH=150 /DNA_ID=CAMNT_0001853729 /DNA_START=53 /DNA_END=506 /DNA_ORIENTATION=+
MVDMRENILWTQRIEKEERIFINGARIREEIERQRAKEARKERRSRHRGGSSRCSESSSRLSLAGSSSVCSSMLTTGAMQKSSSESALVPDHFKAAVHFPLVEKDLLGEAHHGWHRPEDLLQADQGEGIVVAFQAALREVRAGVQLSGSS